MSYTKTLRQNHRQFVPFNIIKTHFTAFIVFHLIFSDTFADVCRTHERWRSCRYRGYVEFNTRCVDAFASSPNIKTLRRMSTNWILFGKKYNTNWHLRTSCCLTVNDVTEAATITFVYGVCYSVKAANMAVTEFATVVSSAEWNDRRSVRVWSWRTTGEWERGSKQKVKVANGQL